jgi:hypothetical protein
MPRLKPRQFLLPHVSPAPPAPGELAGADSRTLQRAMSGKSRLGAQSSSAGYRDLPNTARQVCMQTGWAPFQ